MQFQYNSVQLILGLSNAVRFLRQSEIPHQYLFYITKDVRHVTSLFTYCTHGAHLNK